MFRIGSITKTFTAIAVMQLWEHGLVDLDAPANDYLRTFRLIPAEPSFQPTVRHLLTHTAGVGYWRRFSDLLQPGVGAGVRARASGALPLAEYYRRGLPVEIEPGTKWAYSNHGFAALGQLVEDVSDRPLDRYLRERIFEPLGMDHTDLVRSERVRSRLPTGYVLRSRGLKPVADREVPTPGGGGIYSAAADVARHIAALQQMYAGKQDLVLKPETLASMFQPHFSSTRGCRAWALRSSSARRAATRPSRRPASCPVFTRRSFWLPRTGSESSFSATPEVLMVGMQGRRLRPHSSVAGSASQIRRSAPTSPPAPRPGARSAAGTAPIVARWRDGYWWVSRGYDPMFGRKLPALFERTGLQNITHEASSEVVRGGSPWARWYRESLEVIAEATRGQTAERRREHELITSVLADPSVWFLRELLHACSGRRPQ